MTPQLIRMYHSTMTTIQFSDLQKLIHNELTAALKSLNEDIASRFDDIELQMERLTNHVRNESKWLKTELLKITTTNETKASENLQFKNELSTIRTSIENIKTITLNPQVDSVSVKKTVLTDARQYVNAVKTVQNEEKNRDIGKNNLKITGLQKY